MGSRLVTIYAAVILAIWALSFVVSALTEDFTAFGIATPVVLLAAGALFAIKTPPWSGPGAH